MITKKNSKNLDKVKLLDEGLTDLQFELIVKRSTEIQHELMIANTSQQKELHKELVELRAIVSSLDDKKKRFSLNFFTSFFCFCLLLFFLYC